MSKPRWHWAWLLACCACAASAPAPDALDAYFATAEAVRARQDALDLYARAEAARDLARGAVDPQTRAEHAEQAWLWLQAAAVEAERIELERAVGLAKTRARRAAQARAVDLLALRSLQDRVVRMQAARQSAALAERAAQPPAKEMPRTVREQLDAEAAGHLLERSRLVLAAAVAMGAESVDQEHARDEIAHTEASTSSAHAHRAAAELALRAAQRALEATRASEPPSGQGATER